MKKNVLCYPITHYYTQHRPCAPSPQFKPSLFFPPDGFATPPGQATASYALLLLLLAKALLYCSLVWCGKVVCLFYPFSSNSLNSLRSNENVST